MPVLTLPKTLTDRVISNNKIMYLCLKNIKFSPIFGMVFMISSLGAKIQKKVKKQNKDTFFNAYSLDAKKTYP